MMVCFKFLKEDEKYVRSMIDVPRIGEYVKIDKKIMGRVVDIVWDVDKVLAETHTTVYLEKGTYGKRYERKNSRV